MLMTAMVTPWIVPVCRASAWTTSTTTDKASADYQQIG